MASQIAVTIWDQHNSDFKRQNPLNDSLCFCLGKISFMAGLIYFLSKDTTHVFIMYSAYMCPCRCVYIYIQKARETEEENKTLEYHGKP